MSDVNRFTTKYDLTQDRIQLLVELQDGTVCVLWLTRRLLNYLVPTLFEKLEAGRRIKDAPSPQAHAVQKFAQAAAVSGLKKQKPVEPPEKIEESRSALVTAVDLKTSPKALSLSFKSGQKLVQSLQLTEPVLRQWLEVVQKQYHAAGWSEALWPDWMLTESQGATQDLRLI